LKPSIPTHDDEYLFFRSPLVGVWTWGTVHFPTTFMKFEPVIA